MTLHTKTGSHVLPVVFSGLLFYVGPVPNLFQDLAGTAWISRDWQGQFLIQINNLGAAAGPPESLRRHSFYPLNYEEQGSRAL